MACFLSVRQIHNVSIVSDVFGDPRKDPLFEMEYADPGSVDWRARGKITPTVQMLHGYPVVESTAPKKIHWRGGNRALPDLLVHAGVFVAGERFRALVERFEPGVHQFIPVDIYRNKKGEPAARFYWFNVCTRLDSVDPERTTYLRTPGHEGTFYWSDMKEEGGRYVAVPGLKLVLSRDRIGKHHIWVDPHLVVANYCYASDAFGEAAVAEGITGLHVTPREEA